MQCCLGCKREECGDQMERRAKWVAKEDRIRECGGVLASKKKKHYPSAQSKIHKQNQHKPKKISAKKTQREPLNSRKQWRLHSHLRRRFISDDVSFRTRPPQPQATHALHLLSPVKTYLVVSLYFNLLPSQLLGSKAPSSLQLDRNILDSSTHGNVAQASPIDKNALNWVKNDNRRLLHVVYRVGNLDRTIKFYTECLGMKVLRKRDIPQEKYSNAFLGYGPEESHFAVELTYNYGVEQYDIGSGFGYFGVAVEDVAKTADLVKTKGGNVAREPGPVKGGSYVNALIEDPDGYKFKLQEKKSPAPEPFCQVMLRVGDLDRSINFYKKAFGLKLLRKWDYPVDMYSVATMGYGPEDTNAVLELNYNYGVKGYDKGNGYAQIAIGTDDVYKTAEAIRLCGGTIVLDPGPLPGINTKITACLDPDGWKTVFVDNTDFLKELV